MAWRSKPEKWQNIKITLKALFLTTAAAAAAAVTVVVACGPT